MKLMKATAYTLMLGLALSQTGCLKTRAQLKNEQDQSGDAAQDDSGGKQVIQQKPGNYEMEEVKSEVTRLSGRLDEIDHNTRNQPNATELKEYVTRLDGRIAELEKNQMLVMGELKALKDKSTADAQAAQEAATPPTDLLTKANQLLSEKKCDEAEDAFRKALTRNLKPKEAADAHFGLGETQYCKKDYKKAILEYSAVRKANPKSAKIPPSLYRIGLAFNHLNMAEEAKGFFNEVIEKYPNSPEAKKARARVKE